MYEQRWSIISRRAREIISYDTIVYPLDIMVWVFTLTIIVAQFILLIIMQNLWSIASGKPKPQDYIFQGLVFCKLSKLSKIKNIF